MTPVTPAVVHNRTPDEVPVEVSHCSGMRAFAFERHASVVARLCANAPLVTQTKLYKPLFYSDFLPHRSLGRSLTGVAYCRRPYGPVPVGFSVLRSALEEGEIVSVEEVSVQNGNTGEVFRVGPRGVAVDPRHARWAVAICDQRSLVRGSRVEGDACEGPDRLRACSRAVDCAACGVVSACPWLTPCQPQKPPPPPTPLASCSGPCRRLARCPAVRRLRHRTPARRPSPSRRL